MGEVTMSAIDGTDALAAVLIRPSKKNPGSVSVEAWANGISKEGAAIVLRHVADGWSPVNPLREQIVKEIPETIVELIAYWNEQSDWDGFHYITEENFGRILNFVAAAIARGEE